MIFRRKLLPIVVLVIVFGTWLSLPPRNRRYIENWRYINHLVTLGASHNLYDGQFNASSRNGAHYFTLPLDKGPVAGHANYSEALCHMDMHTIVPDLFIVSKDDINWLDNYVKSMPHSSIRHELKSYGDDEISGHQCMSTAFSQMILVLELGYFASWGVIPERGDFEGPHGVGSAPLESRDQHLLSKYPSLLSHVKFNGNDYSTFVASQREQNTNSTPFTIDHVYNNGHIEKIKHLQIPSLGTGTPAFKLRKTFTFPEIKISLSFDNSNNWRDFVYEPVLRGGERAARVRVHYPGYIDDYVRGGTKIHSFPHNDARFFGDQCSPNPEDVVLLGKVIYGADISMKHYPFDDPFWLVQEADTAWQKVKWLDSHPQFLTQGLVDSMCHFAHTMKGEAFNVELGVGFKCSKSRFVPNLDYFYCQQLH